MDYEKTERHLSDMLEKLTIAEKRKDVTESVKYDFDKLQSIKKQKKRIFIATKNMNGSIESSIELTFSENIASVLEALEKEISARAQLLRDIDLL